MTSPKKRKLFAMLMLATSVTSAASAAAPPLEVGNRFYVHPDANIRSCDTLQQLRSGNQQGCGTIPSSSYEVVQKSDDAFCVKSLYGKLYSNNPCYWVVIAPNTLAPPPTVTAKPATPSSTEEDEKTLDGLSGFAVYLKVCDQFHELTPLAGDNFKRMLNMLPFTMEQRRASFLDNLQKAKGIGTGKFCSGMSAAARKIFWTLENIDWSR
jgi:hypothetical protein